MPSRRAFFSPKMNPLVLGVVRVLMPGLLKYLYGGLSVHIEPSELEKLRPYRGQRMLLLPNHPTGEEPAVLFRLSQYLKEAFYYVAARELFDCERGFRGWVMRRIGTYSVIRGATDRESFLTTKQILMAGKHRLVIFIEGEISRENDTLIPFEPGVLQLALWAQDTLAREAEQEPALKKHRLRAWQPGRAMPGEPDHPDEAVFPPIYLAPVAIKYVYRPGVEVAIDQALRQLEQTVGLTPPAQADRLARVRALGEQILTVQERMHQMVAVPGTSLNERVDAMKSRILKKMELFLDLRPDPDASTLSRIRDIRNTMDRVIHAYEDSPPTRSLYEQRVLDSFRSALREFYQDLDRVVHFLTYDESYLQANPSPERYVEMLRRLEREVYGVSRLTYPRQAVVQVGHVINLKSCFKAYEADKRGFPRQLAQQLEDDMARMLSGLARRPSE